MKTIAHPVKRNALLDKYPIRDILETEIIDNLTLCEYQPGEIIMESGYNLEHYYFFLEGKLKIFQRQSNGRNLLIEFYTAFDTLGDVELMHHIEVTCTVAAVETSYLFRIETDQLRDYAEQNPKFLKYIIKSLSLKLRHADQNYAFNLLNPVKNRLASYIMWHVNQTSNWVTLSESQIEISEYIGTTYRQLHRAFRELEEDLIVQKHNQQVEILNSSALADLAGHIYHLV